jgi:putative component of toxin-antitoxin plasmid stabilization module
VTSGPPTPGYQIEFFRRADGSEPVRRFMDSLTNDKRDALVAALKHVLGHQGLDVCASEWGKQLGGGLAEFRLRHDEREVLSIHSPTDAAALPEGSPERILLRVFFHAHGNRLILLLGGYDKAARPSSRQQQREIERARSYLEEWRAEQTRQRRATPRRPSGRRRG